MGTTLCHRATSPCTLYSIIVFLGFPCGSAGKESACNVGYLGSIPGLRRSPGEGKVYPLQYSSLENSLDCVVHGVTKSQTRLSDFHFHLLPELSQAALVVKNPPASAGDIRDMGSISGLGRPPEEGNGNPLQYSCLENSTDRGAWRATVQGVSRSLQMLEVKTDRSTKRNIQVDNYS